MSKKTKINRENIRVLINNVDISDAIDIESIELKHEMEESVCLFKVPKEVTISKGDKIEFYFKPNKDEEERLELAGKIVKVIKSLNYLKVIGSTLDIKVPDMKWSIDIVNNWGCGMIIVFALVSNKRAGYGFILFNYGFYLYKKPVVATKN